MSDPYQDALDAMAQYHAAQGMAQLMNTQQMGGQNQYSQQMNANSWVTAYPDVHAKSAAYKAHIQKTDPEKWETIAALMALTEAELEIRDSPFETKYMQTGVSRVYQLECYAWGSVIQWLSDETGGDIEQWRQIFGKLADVNQAKAAAGAVRRVKPQTPQPFLTSQWANQIQQQYQNHLAMQQMAMHPNMGLASQQNTQGVANAAIQSRVQTKARRAGP